MLNEASGPSKIHTEESIWNKSPVFSQSISFTDCYYLKRVLEVFVWLLLKTVLLTCYIWNTGSSFLYFESSVTGSCTNVTPYNNIFQLIFENLDYGNRYSIVNDLFYPGTTWHTKFWCFFLSFVGQPSSHNLSLQYRVSYKLNSSSQLWWDTDINCPVPWAVTLNNQASSFPMGIMWLHAQRIIFPGFFYGISYTGKPPCYLTLKDY